LQVTCIAGNIILKKVVKRRDGLDSAGTRFGPDAGSCKQGNEHEGSGTFSPPIYQSPKKWLD
jgi:hypothetical protein